MSNKKLPPGTWPLIIAAMVFIVGGGMVVWSPTVFTMVGSTNHRGDLNVSATFTEESTKVFGWAFVLMGCFIGVLAYRYARGGNSE